MFVFEPGSSPPRYIINFPTKRHWRGKSRMKDIEAGLAALVEVIREGAFARSPFRRSAAASGGWIGPRSSRIEAALWPLSDVRVIVYEP